MSADHPDRGVGAPDRAGIVARQLADLRALVAEVRASNPFYRARWRHLAEQEVPASLQEFQRRFPFTHKSELVEDQRAAPPYGTNLTYDLSRYTRFSQTSGTTGAPLRWLDTRESWSWMVENWVEVLRAGGVCPEDRIFFAFSFGPFLGFWTAFEAGVRLGAMCLPGGGMTSQARLQVIRENRASVLCCTPTYAIRLGEVAREQPDAEAPGPVRLLVLAGEPGGSIPATRARIEQLWPGARVWDHHGMTEVGPVTHECPARPGVLHVMEPQFIAEVIDPGTGEPVGPGSRGELVLTNLGRTGSPLLRYRTGDLVEPEPPARCVCGRWELALAGGILGRTDDMVVVRGVNLYPAAFEAILRGFPAVVEYRVEITTGPGLPEARVLVELNEPGGATAATAERIELALRSALTLRVPVVSVPAGSLPRFELKGQRWLRKEGIRVEC